MYSHTSRRASAARKSSSGCTAGSAAPSGSQAHCVYLSAVATNKPIQEEKMKARFLALFALLLLTSVFLVPSLLGQTHVRHSRYPSAPSNDPQLLLPTDQAQSCFTPESSLSGYDQFEQFDVFPQPASKGYRNSSGGGLTEIETRSRLCY